MPDRTLHLSHASFFGCLAVNHAAHTPSPSTALRREVFHGSKVYRVHIPHRTVPSHVPRQQETTFRRRSSFPSSVCSMQHHLAHSLFSLFVSAYRPSRELPSELQYPLAISNLPHALSQSLPFFITKPKPTHFGGREKKNPIFVKLLNL
jgi:hypothetical protein